MNMEEKSRKYNIGDKVVCIDKGYYDNRYHNKLFITPSVVSDVYTYHGVSNVFHVRGSKHRFDSCGDSCSWQPDECNDETGRENIPIYGKVWYHLEKDKDEIQRIINEAKQEYAEKCRALREKGISETKAEIKRLQEKLARLEAGDLYPDELSFSGGERSEKEWNETMDKLIDQALGR